MQDELFSSLLKTGKLQPLPNEVFPLSYYLGRPEHSYGAWPNRYSPFCDQTSNQWQLQQIYKVLKFDNVIPVKLDAGKVLEVYNPTSCMYKTAGTFERTGVIKTPPNLKDTLTTKAGYSIVGRPWTTLQTVQANAFWIDYEKPEDLFKLTLRQHGKVIVQETIEELSSKNASVYVTLINPLDIDESAFPCARLLS